MSSGRLVVCATPIGNLGDVSERLRGALASADVIYAEDTRRTAKLLGHLGLSVPLVSLFSGNEQSRTAGVVDAVLAGQVVALLSDAGMPTVSDPGSAAVHAVRAAGGAVSVVPGPSAVTAAVALSGFGGDRFVFEGFLPRKGQERAERLSVVTAETRSVIIFASPNRLLADLEDLVASCGPDREIAVARELTKIHEEVWVGRLGDAVDRWAGPVKGEVTLVLDGGEPPTVSFDDVIAAARAEVAAGRSISEVARTVAGETGVSRREIYEALLADQESN